MKTLLQVKSARATRVLKRMSLEIADRARYKRKQGLSCRKQIRQKAPRCERKNAVPQFQRQSNPGAHSISSSWRFMPTAPQCDTPLEQVRRRALVVMIEQRKQAA
ncbi:hypothetical protein NPIL_273271 [Nephila pilipes]|uniref:Uncharacterized protein n=1 Tax=Nephila pilipes TaxID=299642 RepID=A0A8X6NHS0_NEPPI|nr:hypothetical protein NPIL_273271 [Nephila pilipes]